MKMRVLLNVDGDYVVTEIISARYSKTAGKIIIETTTRTYRVEISKGLAHVALKNLMIAGYHSFEAYEAE